MAQRLALGDLLLVAFNLFRNQSRKKMLHRPIEPVHKLPFLSHQSATLEVHMRVSVLQRLIGVEIVALVALVALALAMPARAEATEKACNNLPSGGYRGICAHEGQMGSCLASDTRYCIYSPVELNCFSGWCTGDN